MNAERALTSRHQMTCCWLRQWPYVIMCPQFSSDKLPVAVLVKRLAVICPPLPYIWYNIAQKLLTLSH